MWLKVPEEIERSLWEGPLDLDVRDKRLRGEGDRKYLPINDAQLPLVSIGQPEVWSLTDLYPPEKIPIALSNKLDEAQFFFVRFSCSLRPIPKKSRVTWARFSVQLLPNSRRLQPIAYDMHPMQITQEIKRNVKVTLSPTIKFQEVEFSAGGLEFGFEYTDIYPTVTASGGGESIANWDYEKFTASEIKGTKWMHMLLKVPKQMSRVRAFLNLSAQIEVQKVPMLPALVLKDRKQAREKLSVWLV